MNRKRFPVHSRQAEGPTEIVDVYSAGQWQRVTFLAGYLNCLCLQDKRVLLDTFIVHLSRDQTLVSQGVPVWHHKLACRRSWRCVRLDYRFRVAYALKIQPMISNITNEVIWSYPCKIVVIDNLNGLVTSRKYSEWFGIRTDRLRKYMIHLTLL